jgi:hypothetical protein
MPSPTSPLNKDVDPMSTPLRVLLTLFLILTTSASSTFREYTLDISRAKVTQALMQFSEQTGLQVGYYPDGSTDQPPIVGPLKGRYTAEAGLKYLLAHSGLVHEFVNEHTIVVRREQGGAEILSAEFATKSFENNKCRSIDLHSP